MKDTLVGIILLFIIHVGNAEFYNFRNVPAQEFHYQMNLINPEPITALYQLR